MPDRIELPKTSPRPITALFRDLQTARTAIETMLQGGFHGEQLALMATDESVASPANNMQTYRATGMTGSGSPLDQNQAFIGMDVDPATLTSVEGEKKHAAIVSVQPAEGQERNAREMLVSLGGRLLREDGSLETEAA
jgi:hypothetical protein